MIVNVYPSKDITYVTESVYQYDYGQIVKIHLNDLPPAYIVEFSNSIRGNSKKVPVFSDKFAIPMEYLENGDPIYMWIVLIDEISRSTEYAVKIPVIARSHPTEGSSTPAQQSDIETAIATLNRAILAANAAVEHAEQIARQMEDALQNGFERVLCIDAGSTPEGVTWDNNGVPVVGTLTAGVSTMNKIYLVRSFNGEQDIFDEYISVNLPDESYIWESLGNTDVRASDLGALAWKNNASCNYTPTGSISQQIFTGEQLVSSGNYTPEGNVSTPEIHATLMKTTKYVANSQSGGGTVTPGSAASCNLPSLIMDVSNEELSIRWTAGQFTPNTPTLVTLPLFTSEEIVTGISSIIASDPIFTGIQHNIEVTGTPSGNISQALFDGSSVNIVVK